MADLLNKVGNEQNNNLAGDAGDDNLIGKEGNDELHGREGRDNLYGGSGDDRVFGGKDNDRVFGGEGHDLLRGGDGNDTLTGGSGADRFELVLDGSRDRVTDFSVSQGDKIRIDTANGTEDSFQELGLGISGNTSVTHLQHQGEIVMTLSGIDASDVILGSFNTYFDVV